MKYTERKVSKHDRLFIDHSPNDDFFFLARSTQDFILSQILSRPCKYTLLSALYRSIRTTTNLDSDLNEKWTNSLKSSLSMIAEDLEKSLLPSKPIRFAIYHCDSSEIDWVRLLADIGIKPLSSRGLLITSPTFVNTSQVTNDRKEMCHLLAEEVLENDGISNRYSKKDISLTSDVEAFLEHLPILVRQKLKPLIYVLAGFYSIASQTSLVIIENENALMGSTIIYSFR